MGPDAWEKDEDNKTRQSPICPQFVGEHWENRRKVGRVLMYMDFDPRMRGHGFLVSPCKASLAGLAAWFSVFIINVMLITSLIYPVPHVSDSPSFPISSCPLFYHRRQLETGPPPLSLSQVA